MSDIVDAIVIPVDLVQVALDAATDKVKADALADKAKAKQAVLDKLGLTADEVTALLG